MEQGEIETNASGEEIWDLDIFFKFLLSYFPWMRTIDDVFPFFLLVTCIAFVGWESKTFESHCCGE
jgi:hypothetical protein